MKVLLIFIDGLGIGSADPEVNPLVAGKTPTFDQLFRGEDCLMIPTDASQGVPGIPQSATGQTALLTGVRAAQVVNRHLSGFPGPALREIIAENNILKKLLAQGQRVTFANAYTREYLEGFFAGRIKGSVTTICVETAGLSFRYVEQIPLQEAIYQDFTNQQLIEVGFDLPVFEPEVAAKNLVNIVEQHDFTLYEFFQTDFAGHSQSMEFARDVLENLDRFIGQVLADLRLGETLVVISSDHGNIEDLTVIGHTHNPVPTFLIGQKKAKIAEQIKEITDIAPAIISLFNK